MDNIKVKKESVEVKEDPDAIDFKNRLDINDDDSESDDGEDVYEVERVVGHMNDPVLGLRYQLKWKGYSDSENTYEPEASVFCHGLVSEYWARYLGAGGKKTDQEGHDPKPQTPKRKALQQGLMPDLDSVFNKSSSKTITSTSTSASTNTKSTHQDIRSGSSSSGSGNNNNNNSDLTSSKASTKGSGHRREENKDSTQYKRQKLASFSDDEVDNWSPPLSWETWDSHIERVDAVEHRRSKVESTDKQLIVHIVWKDGKRTEVSSKVAHKKCPQKLLDFYESHLLFQEEEIPA
ncbi:hypothetical protein BGZ49_002927 [Haplosporangium sp. Z 27]|nr:hypothetical protein BGZ49_002927 [Haplosporangium sp. Z 27]